ncbi:MAG: AIR synthase-related protein, partial [Acidimicrobiia bacterium]
HGLAHIKDGGLPASVAKVIPDGSAAAIERSRWDIPEVFEVLQNLGSVSDDEMFHMFNMGIGFVAIAPEGDADRLVKGFNSYDQAATVIGRIVEGDGGVEIV